MARTTKGEPFSVRFSAATDRAIEAEAKRLKRSKSVIVEALADEAGADLFLTKPFSPLDLLRLVDRLGGEREL